LIESCKKRAKLNAEPNKKKSSAIWKRNNARLPRWSESVSRRKRKKPRG
jgi:hypothetical protein